LTGVKLIYTPELTEKLKESYQRLLDPKLVASDLDLEFRSVVAKLSQMGLYKKKEYVNKQGNPPKLKQELIEDLAKLLRTNSEILESLEKCNKNVLLLLIKALDPKVE
jgi:hypothetical protein